ncbi:UNVERIFIED_ORG: hypothetical protein ABIB19_000267 [Arthrobacter sp. UYEF10]
MTSLQDYEAEGRRLLLGGVDGHHAARTESQKSHGSGLLDWALAHFPGAVPTHMCSAQDYQATNLMPSFGALARGRGRMFSAPATTSGA